MSEKKTNLNTQAVLAMKGEGYYSARTAGAKHEPCAVLANTNNADMYSP
ncbi:MAG: hypothetical protein ACPGRU_05535 [Candidatus Puniceispirillaceae bacterium]